MSDKPAAICMLPGDDGQGWVVFLCHGPGTRQQLKQFDTRHEAAEYVLAERDRRRELAGREPVIQFPDDCPCYFDS